jgi:hypothetical protein
MKTRFDLEQEILNCWGVTTDIVEVYEYVMEQTEHLSSEEVDRISNMLLGLSELYDLKFQKLFNTFELLIKNDKI